MLKNFRGEAKKALGIKEMITGVFSGITDSMEAFQSKVKIEILLKVASAIGVLTASIFVLSLIDPEKLSSSLGAITVLFADLVAAMTLLNKLSIDKKNIMAVSGAIVSISVSVLVLASALKKISSLNPNELMTGIAGVAVLTAMMVKVSQTIGTTEDKIIRGATQMVIFATAINLLASACIKLAKLEWEQLAKGLTGVGVLLVAVSKFLNETSFKSGVISSATGILILSAALKVLASVCKDFSSMEWDAMFKGLAGIGGALVVVSTAVQLMPKNMISIGLGLLAISAALVVLSNVLRNIGSMKPEEMKQGLIGLGTSLGGLAIGLKVMSGTLSGSAAILVAVSALSLLVPILGLLGMMSWESIAKGLVSIAGAFTIIGVAGVVLTPLVPTIISLAGAFALIGVGALGVGAGLFAIGAGLAAIVAGVLALTGVGIGGVTAFVASLTVIITGLAGLIPAVISKIGEGIVALFKTLADSAESIASSIVKILSSIITAVVVFLDDMLKLIAKHIPSITQSGIDIVIAFLQGISKNIGKIVDVFVNVILDTLKAIIKKIPDILQVGIDIVIALINGLAKGIEDNAPRIRDALFNLFKSLVNMVLTFLGIHSPSKVFADIGVNIVLGLIKGLGSMLSGALKAMRDIVDGILASISNKFGEFLTNGGKIITNLTSGIVGKVDDVKTAVSKIISTIMSGFNDKFEDFKTMGGNIVEGLSRGIQDTADKAITSAKNMATGLIEAGMKALNINSPSKEFMKLGESVGEGLALGINNNSNIPVNASFKMADNVVNKSKQYFEKKDPSEFGKGFVTQIATGITKNTSKPKQAASKMVDEVVVEVKRTIQNKDFVYLGLAIGEGLAIGLDNSIGPAANATSEMMDEIISVSKKSMKEFESWIGDKKFYSEISLVEELTAWEKVQERYIQGSEERKKADREVYRLQGDLVKATYKNSMDWIEESKYYGRLNLKEELAAYERVQKRHAVGTEERKKMDRELFRLNKEINDATERYVNDSYRLQEERNQKRLQLERDYADRTKQINDKLIQDIRNVESSYESALNSRANSLYNAYGLFNEITKKEPVEGSKLIKNLSDQVEEFADWQKQLGSLSSKGVGSALIEELQAMGPSAISEIKALNSMTESQLKEYETLWVTKHSQVKSQAIDELVGLKKETQQKIEEIKSQSEIELIEYKSMWSNKMTELYYATDRQLENLKSNYEKQVGEISANTIKELSKMVSEVEKLTPKTDSTKPQDNASKYSEAGENLVSEMVKGIQSQEVNVYTLATTITTNVLLKISNLYPKFLNTGENLIVQLMDGIKLMESNLYFLIMSIINTCLVRIRNYYPEFYLAGQTLMLNLINGIQSMSDFALGTITNIIKIILEEFGNSYSSFYEMGRQLIKGFCGGIEAEINSIRALMRQMSNEAVNTARDELQIASPSKVFYEIGKFTGLGFTNALRDHMDETYSVGVDVAEAAKKGLSSAVLKVGDFLDTNLDTQPTIRPVLDLSNIKNETANLDAMFSRNRAMNIGIGMRSSDSQVDNQNDTTNKGSMISFTQNNYSPKPLSRFDIYRQTKNQLSSIERLVF